jgi:DNA-nicking Smr family endonuclease
MMNSLDLHGIKHSEVQVILDQFIWENMQKKTTEVSIITGHSKIMKKIVKEIVEDYMMTCEEEYNNSGKIIIKLV